MSKTKDTTKIRELTEAELAAVSGGILSSVNNVIKAIGDGLTYLAKEMMSVPSFYSILPNWQGRACAADDPRVILLCVIE